MQAAAHPQPRSSGPLRSRRDRRDTPVQLSLAEAARRVQSDPVTGTQESVRAQQRLDDLRRSLYRDGATEEDLRRYSEERAALGDVPVPVTEPAGARMGHHTRRLLVALFATAVVLLAGIGVSITARPVHPTTSPTAAESATPLKQGSIEDIGGGQTLVQEAGVVTSPPTQVVIVGGTAATAQQYQGIGDAVVALDLSSAPFDGSRGVVMLSSTKASPIAWRVLRLTTRRDWTSYEEIVARGTVLARPDVQSRIDFHYVGAPPSRIAIEAPYGVHWTVLVAFLSGKQPLAR